MAGITSYTAENFADVLHKGMLEGVRNALKTRLMNSLEKDVDAAIDDMVGAMKGYVESHMDYKSGVTVFNVLINGVKKQ